MDEARRRLPRIPLPVADIQVNGCREPSCKNYGRPARIEQQQLGRPRLDQVDEGDVYRLGRHEDGELCLRCLKEKGGCGGAPVLKSNQGIYEEYTRITDYLKPGLLGCTREGCSNATVSVYEENDAYVRYGRSKWGTQRYRCNACKKVFTIQTPAARHRMPHKNREIFKFLVNKVPFRRILEITDLTPTTLYGKIRFLYYQCRAFSGHFESKIPTMDFEKLNKRLYIAVDRQDYMSKRVNAQRKYPLNLMGIASAELRTGYVFGNHVNFDPSINPFEAEVQAEKSGDLGFDPVFRESARFQLEKDRKVPVVAKKPAKYNKTFRAYFDEIFGADAGIFTEETDPCPVEDPGDEEYAGPVIPLSGIEIREEYTAYAHFKFLRHLFQKVEKVRFFLDPDAPLAPACLSIFNNEIKDDRCDVFQVQINKALSNEAKKWVVTLAKNVLKSRQLESPHLTLEKIKLNLIQRQVEELMKKGKLQRGSVAHPVPTRAEPEKRISYLTAIHGYDPEHAARLIKRASLHAVDRYFMQIRRRVSIFERPFDTPSSGGLRWHGYAAYDPQVIIWLSEIYRTFYNYIYKGKRGVTPAMRLGLTDKPALISDILDFPIGNGQPEGVNRHHHKKCYPITRRRDIGRLNKDTRPLNDATPTEVPVPGVGMLRRKPEIPDAPRLFVDIETDPYLGRSYIWLIGVLDECNGVFKQFLARSPREEGKILRSFADYCRNTSCSSMVAYSGNDFDRDRLVRRFRYHGIEIPDLLESSVDLLPPIRAVIINPIGTYKLKSLAAWMGYEFQHSDLDGWAVAREYERCVRKAEKIPPQLLEYNADDVYSLATIVRMIEYFSMELQNDEASGQ